ncbi:imelysin family protein [Reichenbachiella carrageenanivorans]|uniref:Imelysin family protein n=1 Tax=Reichenbachiella carrageenanivorans TaxID=2979869 RepID=A0ABY6CXW2_9BACT|nr:imelysin family protein [Reichenbachiella carrageenanivorans]UXX78564.1 imelysin family protein [Reichenbachiella carrageenanivorans]
MYRFFFLLLAVAVFSCESASNESSDDNFDRSAMLASWADHIIIPAYQHYEKEMDALVDQSKTFTADANTNNLATLRAQWEKAYLAWQWVEMFEIGKAEALYLQSYTNWFPTKTDQIDNNISTGSYNLALASKRQEQGFPAIDYMINGLGGTDADILAAYTDATTGAATKKYLTDLTARLQTLTSEVVADWENGYRDTFVNNDGSSATGAVNKVANDYIFYFEKQLRANKIGIPAGVFDTQGDTYSEAVEAYFAKDISKVLYEEGLAASETFFNGQYFGGTEKGASFASYLDYIRTLNGGDDITKMINDQFTKIETTSQPLANDFADQVETNNTLMLQTYDELQKNVVYFKVDMLQALDISVDYVDADGD